MKTIVKKTFLDIQKEEAWLNEQGENGLMLVAYHNGNYEFEDVSPARYQYKIDIPDYSGSKKKDYLNFLEQSGISVVGEYAGRVYLRKNKADGPIELYTDTKDIKKQVAKRYSYFIAIGVSQFVIGIMFLVNMSNYADTKTAPFWITAIFAIAFIISGTIFFAMSIYKQRQHSIKKEDTGIWE